MDNVLELRKWKQKVKKLPNFPDVKVSEWKPILEELIFRDEIHHTEHDYKLCRNFLAKAQADRKHRLSDFKD